MYITIREYEIIKYKYSFNFSEFYKILIDHVKFTYYS